MTMLNELIDELFAGQKPASDGRGRPAERAEEGSS
jgi:hypothetical protein